MRFFFYGTLMDRDVLARVLGRPVVAAALKPAVLRGYRRTAIREGSYPIVLRDADGAVDGLTLDGVTEAESERLGAYEGPRYTLVRTFADFPERGPRAVFVFEPMPGAFKPTDTEWSLAVWQAEHKEKFLAALIKGGRDAAAAAASR